MSTPITADMIKELRERTGVGMGKCKEALEEAKGDMELAIQNLRKAGMASAVKKAGRETNEGKIETAESPQAYAVVEVNAETDFVVKNDKFQAFAKHVAEDAAKTMPASLEAFLASKDSASGMTVEEMRANLVQTIGENIQIRRVLVIPKKSDRSVGLYSHLGGKIVTIVEIEGSSKAEPLAKEIAMHVAAASPDYLDPESVPQNVIDGEKEVAKSQLQGKPQNILDKILDGKVNSFFDAVCLTRQKFIRDDSVTISELVNKKGQELSTPLKLVAFRRWSLGGQG